MKLFEKKCPNCGADLKFNPDDKEVTCEYCHRSYIIEKDENSHKELNVDDFNFSEISGVVKTISTVHIIITIIVVLFIIGVTVTIGIGIYSSQKSYEQNHSSVDSNNENDVKDVVDDIIEKIDGSANNASDYSFVSSYSMIDEETISELISTGKNALNDKISFYKESFMVPIKSDWIYVGSYFLSSKTNNKYSNNYLYDVFKITYLIGGKNIDYYGAVYYPNLKITSDKKIAVNMEGKVEVPRSEKENHKYAFGYESSKDLYNKLIRKNITDYNVEIIGDVAN